MENGETYQIESIIEQFSTVLNTNANKQKKSFNCAKRINNRNPVIELDLRFLRSLEKLQANKIRIPFSFVTISLELQETISYIHCIK